MHKLVNSCFSNRIYIRRWSAEICRSFVHRTRHSLIPPIVVGGRNATLLKATDHATLRPAKRLWRVLITLGCPLRGAGADAGGATTIVIPTSTSTEVVSENVSGSFSATGAI